MANTYLQVAYAQREAVKALGARWDAAARKWYVPDGRDLSPFNAWLPTESRLDAGNALALQATDLLPVAARGRKLSEVLAGVATVVSNAFPASVWTIVDVVEATVRNHVYLDLAERDEQGVLVARARGMIWAKEARDILPKFEAATGMSIGPGLKLLVRARPQFSGQYGFSLVIDALDAEYTLGDLEARKRELRARLEREGLWGRNRSLDKPWDFNKVLVIAPFAAAGLGDFKAEAKRIERAGLCSFVYAHSRFQGEGAALEILAEAQQALQALRGPTAMPDVLVFIRGGGAVNDLAWLNDYELAKFVCLSPIPVYTGIGHERDSTILDEVAHTCFDTPSKVIAGIEGVIVTRASEARSAFELIASQARRNLSHSRRTAERATAEVMSTSTRSSQQAIRRCEAAMTEVRLRAMRNVRSAADQARDDMLSVQSRAVTHVALTRQQLPVVMDRVREDAFSQVVAAAAASAQQMDAVLHHARDDVLRVRAGADQAVSDFAHGARYLISQARAASESLVREVHGQGPEKTLSRGFAHVRDADGKTIMTVDQLLPGREISVTFRDGTMPALIGNKEPKK